MPRMIRRGREWRGGRAGGGGMGRGVRKPPEPMTEPMKRRKRSRSRRVRGREARVLVGGASVLVGRVAAILAAQECLCECGRSMRKVKPNARGTAISGCPPHIMED